MSYTWSFTTGDRDADAKGKKCHRGPMLPIEQQLHGSFTKLVALDRVRKRVLSSIVDTSLQAVQSRELVLRCLYNPVGSMFPDLRNRRNELTAPICEKKNSIVLDGEYSEYYPFVIASVPEFRKFGLPRQHEELLLSALTGKSPIHRVAGLCASLLMGAYVEAGR